MYTSLLKRKTNGQSFIYNTKGVEQTYVCDVGGGKHCNVVGILICIGENLLVDSHYVPI